MLDKAGRTYGCGRLQYEYITETQNPFGSTEATMALPYWTSGCMDTVDGVLFESSTTTPFHFLDQAEYSLAGESSNPVSFFTYPSFNLADGIRHLQFADVRYFLAASPQVEAAAENVPGLVKIASARGFGGAINQVTSSHPVWDLYLIKGTQLVSPLDHLPVVESGGSAQKWLNTNLAWWEGENDWPVELALSGPPNWPRAKVGTLVPASQAVAVKPTRVTDAHMTNSTVSFEVGRLNAPVLVKVPYFPNWHATGALGPYEVSPKFDGSGTDSTSRHSHLRHDTCRSARQARLAGRCRRFGHAHDAPTACHETTGGPLRAVTAHERRRGRGREHLWPGGRDRTSRDHRPGAVRTVRSGPRSRLGAGDQSGVERRPSSPSRR